MEKLKIERIGSKIILSSNQEEKNKVFADYNELVNHINRFKLADLVENINTLPVFWFSRLEPQPISHKGGVGI